MAASGYTGVIHESSRHWLPALACIAARKAPISGTSGRPPPATCCQWQGLIGDTLALVAKGAGRARCDSARQPIRHLRSEAGPVSTAPGFDQLGRTAMGWVVIVATRTGEAC